MNYADWSRVEYWRLGGGVRRARLKGERDPRYVDWDYGHTLELAERRRMREDYEPFDPIWLAYLVYLDVLASLPEPDSYEVSVRDEPEDPERALLERMFDLIYDDLLRESVSAHLQRLEWMYREDLFSEEDPLGLSHSFDPWLWDDLFADPDKIVGEERDGKDQAQGDGWQAFVQNLTDALESLGLEPRDWAEALWGVAPGVGGTGSTLQTNALKDANYAQKTYSEKFARAGKFNGQSIDDVATALRSGKLKPSDVPIDYIVRDGNTLILDTRSPQARTRAGIPRSQWTAINRTGQAKYQAGLTERLARSQLTVKVHQRLDGSYLK